MAQVLIPLVNPVAIDTNYIAKAAEHLILTNDAFSKEWRVSQHDGTLLLLITGEHLSMSHRKTVQDAHGKSLYQIRRGSGLLSSKYFAESSEGGPKLWEMEVHSSLTGTKVSMKFKNVAGSGGEKELDFKHQTLSAKGTVICEDAEVATIEKKRWKAKHQYEVTIAPGLDMSLIVGLVIAFDDKVRTNKGAAAGGAGGSAGAG